jgi:hypothetical protein
MRRKTIWRLCKLSTRLVCQRQAALGWGKGVVENLARDLQLEFPGRNGFSAQNLWLMRQFFNEYSDKPKLQSLIGEISWAKIFSSWRVARTISNVSFTSTRWISSSDWKPKTRRLASSFAAIKPKRWSNTSCAP